MAHTHTLSDHAAAHYVPRTTSGLVMPLRMCVMTSLTPTHPRVVVNVAKRNRSMGVCVWMNAHT